MDGYLKQSTASQARLIGPFVDDTDFKTAETALTIANTDIKLRANGTTLSNKNSGGGTHQVNGMYSITWDATDTANVGELKYSVSVAGALPVFGSYVVLEEVVYDELFGASAIGYVDGATVNATKIGGTTQTGRDIGASVLLSTGTGTGQLDFTSGVVKSNTTQWLGTAASTPTVAGVPNVNVKTWNDLTTVALPLVPTTAGRTLDVSAGGEAGVDWANVGSPTTSLALTGTTIATTQKVDLETIKTNPVVNAGTVTFPTTATLASTTNITAGTVTTATNVTTVNGLAANVITASSIAADAITDAKVASDVTIASVTGAVGSVTGNVGGNVTGSVGSVATGGITAASIADGAIDRATFAADTGLVTIRSNTATAGAGTTITLDASASAVDDFYNNTIIFITGGTGVGQARFISDYVGATKVATVPTWITNPDNTSTFAIIPFGSIPGATAPTAADVADAVWDEARSGHVTSGSFGEYTLTDVVKISGDATAADNLEAASDGTGYNLGSGSIVAASVTGNVGGNVTGSIGSLATQAKADVNAEADTALSDYGPLKPTTAGRTLDVTATGEAGIDWANVGAPTTTLNLSGTTVKTATDVETDTQDIQNRLPSALISGRMDSNVQAMANDVITAAAIATDAITSAELAASAVSEIQSGLSTLDAAGVRTAVGLASANLDTQLDALPTNAELATALAAADDAVLAAIAALNNISTAQVNAQVVDALATDTYAELTGPPAATSTLAAKINWLFLLARNKITQTSTTQTVRNDADSADVATSTVSDDGTTFVRNEFS